MPIIKTNKDLKERHPRDFYPTPKELVKAMVDLANDKKRELILDPGMGSGIFGEFARRKFPFAQIDGVDIEYPRMLSYGIYDNVFVEDFMTHWYDQYDLVIGNPPYKFAEQFIRKCLHLLYEDGDLWFLLRLEFLGSQSRFVGLWQEFPPDEVYVCSARPSFSGDNHTDATEYGVFHWHKPSRWVRRLRKLINAIRKLLGLEPIRKMTELRWLQWKIGQIL